MKITGKQAPEKQRPEKAAPDVLTREEFDELEQRVTNIEKALGDRARELREPQDTLPHTVTGLSFEPDPDDPARPFVHVDATACAAWGEKEMVVVGDAFGLNLRHLRGQPRLMRDMLYEELEAHNITPVPSARKGKKA